jgi:hypothetical protein
MRRSSLVPVTAMAIAIVSVACTPVDPAQPICSQPEDAIVVLQAQSVPSATQLPCIAELPIGWRFGGSLVNDGGSTLWLDHDRAGVHAVEVELTASCDVSAGVEVPPAPDEVGMRTYQEPESLDPFVGSRSLVFDGGCIVYRYRFAPDSEPALVIEADSAVSVVPRSSVVAEVRETLDLTVCGAEAPPCEG